MTTILIVDDDVTTRGLLAQCFRAVGYAVEQAGSGAEMHTKLARRMPDLNLLDMRLPDEDGLVLLRQIRARSDVPVVMLSAYADDDIRIAGLKAGADDFISKSWPCEEWIARVQSVLRRARGEGRVQARYIAFDRFTLDSEGHRLIDEQDREIPLTTGQFSILLALLRAKGRVLSRGQLLDAICRGDEAPMERTVDVWISQLRGKLGDTQRRLIRTVPNAGYQLCDRGTADLAAAG